MQYFYKKNVIKLIIFIFFSFTFCSKNFFFNIITTTGIIKDAVKNITKKSIQTTSLMGAGVDPHLYKATQLNLKQLNNSNIIFYNGLNLEGKMSEIFKKLNNNKNIYAISNSINIKNLIRDISFSSSIDPHIWFSVKLWINTIKYINNVLKKKITVYSNFYQNNTNLYIKNLKLLNKSIKKNILKIKKKQRVLITAHDAFSYFGKSYNIKVKGLQGISTVSEFGIKDIIELINFIILNNIKAIFLETSIPDKPLQAVIEGCKEKKYNVIIGGGLHSDAIGEANTFEDNYIGIISSNTKTILNTLK